MADSDRGTGRAGGEGRRHRRVVRPATGGDPERALDGFEEADPGDGDWAQEGGTADPGARKAARDRWWQEQRPPHWE